MIDTQDKKAMKSNRVKSYFLQSAKDIVVNEGAESITVRKIADAAGYSYGTIYHYFADLNELLFEVKQIMIVDVMGVMNQHPEKERYSIEDIKMQNHMFVDYFIENPNIYNFFYSYQIISTGESVFDNVDIGEANWNTYKGFVEDGTLKKEDVPTVSKTMIYLIYGMLTLYFSSNGLTKEKLNEDLDMMVDYILKGNK